MWPKNEISLGGDMFKLSHSALCASTAFCALILVSGCSNSSNRSFGLSSFGFGKQAASEAETAETTQPRNLRMQSAFSAANTAPTAPVNATATNNLAFASPQPIAQVQPVAVSPVFNQTSYNQAFSNPVLANPVQANPVLSSQAGSITPGGIPAAQPSTGTTVAFLGNMLTTDQGRTVYRNMNDGFNQTTCAGICAQDFQPYQPSPGAKPSNQYGYFMRPDGKFQWTFQGQPLYVYKHDVAPGQANGAGRLGMSPINLGMQQPVVPAPTVNEVAEIEVEPAETQQSGFGIMNRFRAFRQSIQQ